MPVGVGVVAGRDLVLVLVGDQAGHRVRRRAVHPDLAVGVQGHERPLRVDGLVDHGQVEVEILGDVFPVLNARAAQRVGADLHPGLADGLQVQRVGQVVAVAGEVVEPVQLRLDVAEPLALDRGPVGQQVVGPGGDHAGRVGVGRPTVRRVVLEAAVARRVVRGGDHDPVGGVAGVGRVGVVHHDRPGHRRGRGVVVVALAADRDAVGDQHLDRRGPGRLGQRMGVLADIERTGDALARAVLHDRLRGGRDMGVVEGRVEAGTAVPRRTEHHLLVRVGRVGNEVVVRVQHRVDVDQVLGKRLLSCAGVCHDAHCADSRRSSARGCAATRPAHGAAR